MADIIYSKVFIVWLFITLRLGSGLDMMTCAVSALVAGGLVGLKVYTVEDLYLGTVTAIAETGSNDVYVVTGGGEEILLPAIKEVIRSIDLEEGRMVVALPAGEEV